MYWILRQSKPTRWGLEPFCSILRLNSLQVNPVEDVGGQEAGQALAARVQRRLELRLLDLQHWLRKLVAELVDDVQDELRLPHQREHSDGLQVRVQTELLVQEANQVRLNLTVVLLHQNQELTFVLGIVLK